MQDLEMGVFSFFFNPFSSPANQNIATAATTRSRRHHRA
jgi:hypothetical protein